MDDISQDVLIKAAEGDRVAFDLIYNASSGFVYNLALRVVNNREDAKEVAQDVFLIIYRKLKDFNFESSFKTWVYRISINCAIDFVRKSPKLKTSVYDENTLKQTVDDEARQNMDNEYNSKIIEKFLSALAVDQRVCVVLRMIEGLSYQEIANTLKTNINTVRTRLKRAREKWLSIRKKVDDE